jgi:hypothetical protein
MDLERAMNQMTAQGLPAVHIVSTALMGKTANHLKEDHNATPHVYSADVPLKETNKANAALHIAAHRKRDS